VFVSLSAIQDATFVAPAIAEAFGLLDVSAVDLPRRARAACGDRSTLLVLDNFEHVLGAAPLVGELLSLTFSLRALVTSRAALRVRGEREYVLDPLELASAPDGMSPADLARVPAVRLFVERIREVQPEFRLTSANGATVAAICRRLDALPLALELAAPWIKVLTLDGLLQRLERSSLLGAIGVRDLPARQQTMNATVAWSYQLLDPGEQRAFRSFGALPGPFSIDAAAAVLAGADPSSDSGDQALRSAAALIDRSLLLRSDTSPAAARPLYHMLETVRAYAALELVATGERDEAMQGLVRHCTTRASLAAEGIVGPEQTEWLDRVREDLESYRAAMAWLIERSRAAEASHIAWSLMWFWQIRGHGSEGLRWYQQILSLPQLPVAAEARALLGSAAMWYGQGELARARTALTRVLAIASEAHDIDAVMHAQFIAGHVEQALGNFEAARDCFTRSVEGFELTPSVWARGHLLTALAWVALCTGDIVQTEQLLDAADVPLRRAGPFFRSLGMYLRALLAIRRGDASTALALVRDSLALSHELKDRFACVYSLVPLAAAAALEGDDEWVARVVGVQDAVTDSTGATVVDSSVQDLREKVEREAKARLGAERWTRAYAAGRKISIDALIKDIDSSRP
jgi:predicted ATPase